MPFLNQSAIFVGVVVGFLNEPSGDGENHESASSRSLYWADGRLSGFTQSQAVNV
jgi:hypothetical protein